MSEKRFTVDGLNIQDNSIKGRLYLLEEQGGVNALCNLINGLNEKYEKQQATIKQLQQKLEMKTEEVEYLKRMMVKWGLVTDE